MFFSDRGTVYSLKVYNIPEGTSTSMYYSVPHQEKLSDSLKKTVVMGRVSQGVKGIKK
jgi:DNA gyrase/topoisomerase IV subunit A